MNPSNIDQLKVAAEAGNIDLLYAVIQDDSSILENIDSKQFVETPLHIAASRGHLRFAAEIMNLKPSFALKLNQQGFSPIHLAIQNNQKRMVLGFVDMNRELVRVKGREGWTPLHFASHMEEVDLLAKFVIACPESIEDVTVRGETALHIAVKNNKYEALHLLVCFLGKSVKTGAWELEYKILNWKDEIGNTVLHISALSNKPQELRLLVKCRINLKAKNLENRTALDIATTLQMKKILINAGAKPGSKVTDSQTRADKLKSKSTIIDKMLTYMFRIRNDILEKERNTWLIVAALVATATYQSALSPTGGVYQANVSDKNLNTTSSNSTTFILRNGGKSVLSEDDFLMFSLFNMFSFFVSTISILIMTPTGLVGTLVSAPVAWFGLSYLFSMRVISPTPLTAMMVMIFFISAVFAVWIVIICIMYMQRQCYAKILNRS